MDDIVRDRAAGALVGLAVGDAIGTTVEFKPRGTFPPVTDMVGGGPFRLQPGQWTDDTSMALCLAESLITRKGFDPVDQLQRYVRWYRDGHLSSTGVCFDIGNQTRLALEEFEKTGDPYCGPAHPRAAGNGSLMRLAPVAIAFHPDIDAAIHYAGESSRTTHGAEECIDACRFFAMLLIEAIQGASKMDICRPRAFASADRIREIATASYVTKSRDAIRGSGYVVDSLEAALWCFHQTSCFEEAVLMAANLGDDADTTAAIAGQIAGAHYGLGRIRQSWVERLAKVETIRSYAAALFAAAI